MIDQNLLKYCTTQVQADDLQAIIDHGSANKAAKVLGRSRRTLDRSLINAKQLSLKPKQDVCEDGVDSLMTHSVSSNTRNNAARYSHNTVQGHHHSVFEISWYADMQQLRWSMSVGCLMDPNSVAAKYAAGNVLKRPVLGCGVIRNDVANMLVISDMHLPYQHQDAMDFLLAVKRKYNCKKILNVGDVIDHHRGSYHESEPGSMDAEAEYYAAKRDCQKLQKLFPEMIITRGNHDNIPTRKLMTAGLPTSMMHDMNALYGLHEGWQWVDTYKFDSHGGTPILVPMTLNKEGRWVG